MMRMNPRVIVRAALVAISALVLAVLVNQEPQTQRDGDQSQSVSAVAFEIDVESGTYTKPDPFQESQNVFKNFFNNVFAQGAGEVDVNAQLELIELQFPPAGTTPPGGIFPITATIENLGPSTLQNLFFRVSVLEYTSGGPPQPELANRNEGTPAGVGAEITAVLPGGTLEPGERFDITYEILLPRIAQFRAFADGFTIPPDGGAGPLDVEIVSPNNLNFFGASPITVTGTVQGPVGSVEVNGVPATLSPNPGFTAEIDLKEGNNTITAVARDITGDQVDTDSIQVTLDTTAPAVKIDSPPDGFVTNAPTITVAGMINDIVVGTVNGDQAQVLVQVDGTGVPALVSNRSFVAADVPLAPGSNTITAFGTDKAGNQATATVNVIFEQIINLPTIKLVSGNNQSGPVGSELPDPLVVELNDENGNPVAGENVIFKVMENNGTLSNGVPTELRSLAVPTDALGQAQVNWTLGTRAGAGNNMVEANAVGFEGMAIFTATATFGEPDKINVDSGNNQVGEVGEKLPNPFVAVVTDAGHNRLAGVPVTFAVTKGGGNINGQNSFTVNTDSDGRAFAVLTLGPNSGFDNNMVDATFPGNPGFPAMFVASGLIVGNPAETEVSGVVLDNTDVPISGVTVGIVGTNLETQTDEEGQFSLIPAPVGHVLLHVDGTTANRPGTWPALEFELTTVAGQNNTIGMPIYLLPIDVPGGLFVDEDTGGVLTLPEVPGFSLTIEPGSATFPDGSNSGVVSVTVVHNDKVPMTPNFGQQPLFVVTIQPAGVLFDPPAPLTIPNLEGLAPGEITEMYSFDHDLGRFVSIGTGTVSEDGSIIASDPGVGIIKGGWHCGGNPAQQGGAQNANVNITTPGPVILSKDDTTTISANGTPQPGTFSWSSSNSAVAQIQGAANGSSVTIKALSQGTATITVVYTCQSGASDSDSIEVIVGPTLEITSLNPAGMFNLGDDLTINFKIEPPGTSFDTVDMEIKNKNGTIVFKQSGLPTGAGTHSTTWTDGKWNQAPHSGAFANPNNSPYEIKLIGKKGADTDEDTESVSTKLKLSFDIEDQKQGAASESSGLDDVGGALKVVIQDQAGNDEAVISGASIMISGANRDMKQAKVEGGALNTLSDGEKKVIARDLRDEIGNFADDDNDLSNGANLEIGQVELR